MSDSNILRDIDLTISTFISEHLPTWAVGLSILPLTGAILGTYFFYTFSLTYRNTVI